MAKSVFDIPVNEMPHVSAGDPIRASDFNKLADGIERIQKGVNHPQQVNPPPLSGSGELISCVLVTVHRNHLKCTRKDSGAEILVARPLAARGLIPDPVTGLTTEVIFGQTWTYTYTDIVQATTPPSGYMARTATSGAVNEEQIVLRPYTTGQEIHAAKLIGGTGITEAPNYIEVHSDRTWYRKQAAT